jgi:hypothetical protein
MGDLVATLSDQLVLVRRLRPPRLRALGWVGFGTGLIAILVLLRRVRADLQVQARDPAYLMQVAGAWLTRRFQRQPAGSSARLAPRAASFRRPLALGLCLRPEGPGSRNMGRARSRLRPSIPPRP